MVVRIGMRRGFPMMVAGWLNGKVSAKCPELHRKKESGQAKQWQRGGYCVNIAVPSCYDRVGL